MLTIKTSDARKNFSETISRVAYGGERVVLRRNKKPLAVLISYEDSRLLQFIEDRVDKELVRKALTEVEEEGSTSWDDFTRELGL